MAERVGEQEDKRARSTEGQEDSGARRTRVYGMTGQKVQECKLLSEHEVQGGRRTAGESTGGQEPSRARSASGCRG